MSAEQQMLEAIRGRESMLAALHFKIHVSREGCCCPDRSIACPSCPQHGGAGVYPTCGRATAEPPESREAGR